MPNQILDLYRQQTNDPRSDEELILEWGSKLPAALERPDFRADYERLTKPATPELAPYEPTAGDYVRNAAGRTATALLPKILPDRAHG